MSTKNKAAEAELLREQNIEWLKTQYDPKHPQGLIIHKLIRAKDYANLIEYFNPDTDHYQVVADLLAAQDAAKQEADVSATK